MRDKVKLYCKKALNIVKTYFSPGDKSVLKDRLYLVSMFIWLPVMISIFAFYPKYLDKMLYVMLFWLYMYHPQMLSEILHWLDVHMPSAK